MAAGLAVAGTAGSNLWAQTITTSGTETRIQVAPQSELVWGPDPLLEQEKLNLDLHKAVAVETEKLLELARQLNAQIASAPADSLTPEQIRKLTLIEKLAHEIKSKTAHSLAR